MNFDEPELIKKEYKKPFRFKSNYELIIYKGKWVNSILVKDNCNKCSTMLGYYSETGIKRTNRSDVVCDDCKWRYETIQM